MVLSLWNDHFYLIISPQFTQSLSTKLPGELIVLFSFLALCIFH